MGKTIIADNLDNATAMARKYRYAVKIVTLQGDVLNTSGSISGGSKNRRVRKRFLMTDLFRKTRNNSKSCSKKKTE